MANQLTEEQRLAQETLALFDWFHPAHEFTQDKPGCTRKHICVILQQVIDAHVTGPKAHRFIGWAQGVMCIEGFLTLEDARNINRKVIEEMDDE